MIIEIKVANFRSIGPEQTLSFVADRATRHPDNLVKRPGYRLVKAVGLFGANASGKSNLVKAIGAVSAFVRDGATGKGGGGPILAAEPYRLDPELTEQASRFEVTFVIGGAVYVYGFAADRERVWEEWLSARAETGDKERLGFRRVSPGGGGEAAWTWHPRLASAQGVLEAHTGPDTLALSVAGRDGVSELLPVFRYLADGLPVYDAWRDPDALPEWTARRCGEDETFRRLVEGLLHDADTGVESLSLVAPRAPRLLPDGGGAAGSIGAYPVASGVGEGMGALPGVRSRRHERAGTIVEFDFGADDSHGTRRLFGLAGVFLGALVSGAFLVIDGLDAGLHPLVTRKLLELFQNADANPHGAQLLFTAHDAVLMDSDLFRRDQVWLAEKTGGESTFYSLADIEPRVRNTESFLKNYLAGRYGGTPSFGPALSAGV